MSASSRNLLRFLGATVAVMGLAVALNFIVDPLQLFRPARLFTAMYSQDSRIQNAGLIRSQKFDTAFMGTSLAIHFRQSDIDRILGVKSLKLAMSGSSSREQAFVLAAAMVRHLLTDPMLPDELLPGDWPGAALRAAYHDFATELLDRRDPTRLVEAT